MGIFRRRRGRADRLRDGLTGAGPARRSREDPLAPRTDALSDDAAGDRSDDVPDTVPDGAPEGRPTRADGATGAPGPPGPSGATATSVPPDPGLPMFDGAQARRFSALAREVFAERGLECSYADGYLKGTDGRSYGLTNVGLLAQHGAETQWRDLLEQHVLSILAAHAIPHERDLDAVRDRLFLRLWATEDLPARPDTAEPLGDGLVGLASIDHPEHVETLTGARDVELLGGWHPVREVALANLAALRCDEVVPVGDDPASRVQLSVGGFFNASRVFTMERLLSEDFLVEAPSHGVLFVVPNRHLVAVHPLAGPGMVGAVGTLIRLARGEYDVPGSISPHVWFWRDGGVQQVTRPAEDDPNAVELHVDGLLEQAMRELGLIEDT